MQQLVVQIDEPAADYGGSGFGRIVGIRFGSFGDTLGDRYGRFLYRASIERFLRHSRGAKGLGVLHQR